MKVKRIYEGISHVSGQCVPTGTKWARRWDKLFKKAAELRYKKTGCQTMGVFSSHFTHMGGKLIRAVVEELVEDTHESTDKDVHGPTNQA